MRTFKLFFVGSAAIAALACNKGTEETPFLPGATDSNGASDSDSNGDAGPCALGGPGPLELDGTAKAMPGQVVQIQLVGTKTVACGQGFIAIAGGDDIDVTGTCTGLAAVGDSAVAMTVGTTLRVFEVDGKSLSAVDDIDVGSKAHDVASDGDVIVVAAGASLPVYAFGGSALSDDGTLAEVTNVRSVAAAGSGWIIVEQDGTVRLLDAQGGSDGEYADATTPVRVESDGKWAVVMRGGFGVDIFDVRNGLEFVETFRVTGTAVDGAIDDDIALIATGAAIERFELSKMPALSGRVVRPDFGKVNGDWLRAVAISGGEAAASSGADVHPVTLGDGEGPVLLLEQSTLSLFADDGNAEVITVVRNIGNGKLKMEQPSISDGVLDIASIEGAEEKAKCDQLVLEPGGTMLITLEGKVKGSDLQDLDFVTNDPGSREITLRVETNRKSPKVGDALDDFSALTLDGDLVTLDQLRGEVLFLKMFAPS